MTERFTYLLIRFIEKAVWFLKIYIREYRYLLAFLAVFVFCYILFMHWLNIRFLRVMRRAAALACLGIELAAILVSFVCSAAVEVSQFVFRIGLFEFDDIFNNVLGALAGWCVFHILHSFRHRRKHGNVQKQDSFL